MHIWGYPKMFEIKGLSVNYGGIEAVRDISLSVPKGSIVTLIGANGAGKSTTLRTIAGLVKPRAGRIEFEGEDITGKDPAYIVGKGITLVPEGRRIFPDRVFKLFPRLRERSWQYGGTLSGGEQQMLAVGRALMSKPKLMMMDEPSLGLAPLVVKDIFSIIEKVNDEGVTILLIEQNANMALKIADIGYVMETGQITLSGKGSDLITDEGVRKAYLGG